jgi:protein-disulfide isomerase
MEENTEAKESDRNVENAEIKGVVNDKFLDRKKSNKVMITSVVVLGFFVIALFSNGFGFFNGQGKSVANLEIGNSPVIGNSNASVTLFEFSDFSCPFCAAANGYNEEAISALKKQNPSWEAPLPMIIKNYVDKGLAKIVFKYAKGHGTGQNAQVIGWCLDEQELFWEFHDAAFKNQKDISDFDKMKALALGLGADASKLDECLGSNKYNSRLNEENNYSNSVGVSGTPTFFVNGQKVEGAVSYSEFKKVIDSKLGLI